MPSLILKSKFVLPNKVKYSSYVDYMSRKNAIYKDNDFDYLQFKNFNDYMSDQEKTTGLFTKYNDYLNPDEKKELKTTFEKSQMNDSVLWQDVFSFDNDWLNENGFMNKGNEPDAQIIREATRNAMDRLFKEEKMETTGVWSAAIHMNTDNIHVHVATVEKNNTRERKMYPDKNGGKILGFKATRKPLTLDHMKSSFINTMTNRDKNLEKISSLRNDLYSEFNLSEKLNKDKSFYSKQTKKILKELPENKKDWNYKNISPKAKVEIQKVVEKYKEDNPKYNEFSKYVNQESNNMKKLYGKSIRDTKGYAKNKEDDLNYRLGNRFLKELKNNSKEINVDKESKKNKKDFTQKQNKMFFVTKKDIRKINEAIGSEFKEQINIMEFEKVQREQERLNQNQEMER